MKKPLSFVILVCLMLTVFTAPLGIPVYAKDITIKDFSTTDKDYEKIQYVLDQGYMKLALGKFYPNKYVKRNEFALILTKLNGDSRNLISPAKSSFQDVSTKDQFYKYIETAKGYMVTYKNSKGKLFKPNSYITREDSVMSIIKILGFDSDEAIANNEEIDISLSEIIEDSNKISPALVKYVATAISAELIDVREVDDKLYFDPQKNITRKDLAVLLCNVMQHKNYNKTDTIKENDALSSEKTSTNQHNQGNQDSSTQTTQTAPNQTTQTTPNQTKFTTTEKTTVLANERSVRIKLVDDNGVTLNPINCKYAFRCGGSENVGTSEYRYFSQVGDTKVNISSESIDFMTNKKDSILCSVSFTYDKVLYLISCKFDSSDKLGVETTRTYKTSDLKKIKTSANFFNNNQGRYELSVIDPYNTFYSENSNASFKFNPSEEVDVYSTFGSYLFIYKFYGDCEGAISAKLVDTTKINSLSINKSDVKLVKSTHRISSFLNGYRYINIQFVFNNAYANVYGSLNDENSFDIYVDSSIAPSFSKIYFCKDPGGKLYDAIDVIQQRGSSITLGNNYKPDYWVLFDSSATPLKYNICFSDEFGNVIRFIGYQKNADEFQMQIMDIKTGSVLYTGSANRNWNQFETGLANGRYKMKIYPITVSENFNTCTYYELSIDGANYYLSVIKLEKMN